MDKHEMKFQLRNKLLQIQSARSNGSSEIIMRCQFCGDSQKDLSHGHFYIKLNPNDDEPVIFHCFRCEISGVLTPSILRLFKINDLQLNSGLITYNKKTLGKNTRSFIMHNNDLNLKVPIPKDTERTLLKQKYIEERLGIKSTIEELVDLKVIFNLGDFLRYNGIETLTVGKQRAHMLHTDYVGFLAAKDEFITFRDITNTHKRYDKYSVFNNLDDTRKFYTIPNNIDILTTNKILLNIAEGVFDILGVYNHLYNKNRNNIIYTAINGAGYISVLKYFIQIGIFGNVDINIYSDKDRDPTFYVKLKEELKDWVDNIYLFYNEKGKDYGVPKDKIQIIRKKIER